MGAGPAPSPGPSPSPNPSPNPSLRPSPNPSPTPSPSADQVDYQSLYEETAPPYSACFTEGAWFARGLPDGAQPNSRLLGLSLTLTLALPLALSLPLPLPLTLTLTLTLTLARRPHPTCRRRAHLRTWRQRVNRLRVRV